MMALLATVLLAATPTSPPVVPEPSALALTQRRCEQCRVVWQAVAPGSYHAALADFLVTEHERHGLGSTWWQSLVMADYASGLNPRMSCRGGGLWARGLMDCTQLNGPRGAYQSLGSCDLFDPWVSIRSHCEEAAQYHQTTGREGWALLRMVFLPRSPEGRRARQEQRRWLKLEAKHLKVLRACFGPTARPL